MQRYRIQHRTAYYFSEIVQLGAHDLRLRPREGHDLRIESSKLEMTPDASLRWRRDVEGNSVATATFANGANALEINSEVVIQQFNENPLDFLLFDNAVQFPFQYENEYSVLLDPYLKPRNETFSDELISWVGEIWQPDEAIQTYTLLERITKRIFDTFEYQIREEPGVQMADETLQKGTGSCRDFASLMIAATRHLGLAARFVSGYMYTPTSSRIFGTTHAWMEVFLPGAGWKGFDPTIGEIVGKEHFPVAVSRLPESVPPVEGSFFGIPGTRLEVGVLVEELPS